MSMHKVSLTPSELDGLKAHRLPIGTPSQLSDVFRMGMKWAADHCPNCVSEANVDEVPIFIQGAPKHEVEEPVTAERCNCLIGKIRELRSQLDDGFFEILQEAIDILAGEKEMRYPIVDELQGFLSMIKDANKKLDKPTEKLQLDNELVEALDMAASVEKGKLYRVRFKVNANDYRSVNWPVPYPYWRSGFGDDYSIVVAYVNSTEEIMTNWPEARDLEVEEVTGFLFTSRFPKPDWFDPATTPYPVL